MPHDAEVNLPPHGKRPRARKTDPLLPCNGCGKPTHRATLAMFGARCATCYEAFCRATPPDAGPARANFGDDDA